MIDNKNGLEPRARARISKLIADDNAIGSIRGMIYNQLQEWKRKIYEPEGLNVMGEAWKAQALSLGDIAFIQAEMTKIVGMEYSDEFLLMVAKKVLKSLEANTKLSVAQQGLYSDLKEILEGVPF